VQRLVRPKLWRPSNSQAKQHFLLGDASPKNHSFHSFKGISKPSKQPEMPRSLGLAGELKIDVVFSASLIGELS